MRAEIKPQRRIWPWVAIGGAILVAVVTAVFLVGRGGTTSTPDESSRPTTSASPVSGSADVSGCLGGETRDAQMVLVARSQAPHSSDGAIEVATAFVRWLNQYPYPTSSDIADVEKEAVSSAAQTKDVAAFFAGNPNLSGGLVADDSPYYLSTIPGVYYLESAASDRVTASIGTALVVDGALSPTLKGSITVTVSWEKGGWKFVSSSGKRTTQELYSIGLPFASGC